MDPAYQLHLTWGPAEPKIAVGSYPLLTPSFFRSIHGALLYPRRSRPLAGCSGRGDFRDLRGLRVVKRSCACVQVSRFRQVLVVTLLTATAAFAQQASITGVVRDTSGAVLPGVTVEASSPALIEQSRSVVSDGAGQYRLVDLRAGTYAVTFSIPGFTTIRREGIELTATFVATVNADLRVAAVAETVTVSGESPIVDIQSSQTVRTIDSEVFAGIPEESALYAAVTVLMPGISAQGRTSAAWRATRSACFRRTAVGATRARSKSTG